MTAPIADIEAVRRAHARLLETVARVDDETAQQPSLLPGWDVAMLLTHLARNADSHIRALEGAAAGQPRTRYTSVADRDAAIAEGGGRSAGEVVADVAAAVARLEGAWASLPEEAWSGDALTNDGEPEPVAGLPWQRLREVEVHHVDLGLGFTPEEWDEQYVEVDLAIWIARLPDRLPPGTGALIRSSDTGERWLVPDGARITMQVEAPARSLLAWLVDRRTDGFPELGPWPW